MHLASNHPLLGRGLPFLGYDLPLLDWINISLKKPTLEQAVNAIRSSQRLDPSLLGQINNKHYIEKILREEVINQFSKNERPMLEPILNAIDARPKHCEPGEYEVWILNKGFKAPFTTLKSKHHMQITPRDTSFDYEEVLEVPEGIIEEPGEVIEEPEPSPNPKTNYIPTPNNKPQLRIQKIPTKDKVA